jgi:hypothetical protein
MFSVHKKLSAKLGLGFRYQGINKNNMVPSQPRCSGFIVLFIQNTVEMRAVIVVTTK